jgi:Ca-activated chloride channel family protein
LTAEGPSGPVAFDVRVDGGPAVRGRAVATLAARARIRELEESPEWTTARGSRQRSRKNEAVTAEIVRLSIRYGLMSRETSYVAIERRDTPVVGDVQLRRVPIALTAGWGGLDALHFASISRLQVPAPGMVGALPFEAQACMSYDLTFENADVDDTSGIAFHRSGGARDRRPAGSSRRSVDAQFLAGSSSSSVRGMHALVSLQRADGSWELTNDFARAIGQELRQLESAVADAKGDRREVGRVWATALALVWLRDHATDVEDEWRLLAHKACEWLRAVAPDRDAWIETAERFLRTI